ncbi:MAG: DNA cytosine methyltransferase [Candidatus Saccharimonadales bacterium]
MKTKNVIQAADLFCGAGGTSQGLLMAANDMGAGLELVAVNHSNIAIETHSMNHAYAKHLCTGLDNVDPRQLVPGGHLHILCASPECTHHSKARGGKPMSDQSRASAWHILRFAEALYIDNIICENVGEFLHWGPLSKSGRPLKSKKGQLFEQFINSLKALGYKVEWRLLNCADYGDPTTRERLFILARRGNKKIRGRNQRTFHRRYWPIPDSLSRNGSRGGPRARSSIGRFPHKASSIAKSLCATTRCGESKPA